MTHRRLLHALTIVAALAPLVAVSHSVASDCDTSPAAVCSRCGEKVCVTFVSPATETASCWEVECDEVCVPAVRCPWHRCPQADCDKCTAAPLPRCGKVRGVRKLKQVEYECDTCRYEHRIVCRCPNCGPLPHGECGCVPLAATPAEEDAQAGQQTRLEPATASDSQSQQAELAAESATPEPRVKPRWSDRLRSRLVSWKQRLGPQPQPRTDEGDLSQLIGHTRFGNEQSE